ncbi:MAG: serine hydrolase [Planctomycetales bacterium]|nr:serine hydrolase [Planctomycetales bacterium]
MPTTTLVRIWVMGGLLCGSALGQDILLPRSSPEAQGVSSEQLLSFVETANDRVKAIHSFMVLRHGNVVAEGWWSPEAADKPHVLWSLSKSFTSTAVGLAVEEGKFSIDDPVIGFFPAEAPPEPTDNLKAMRVRDLLTMSTGHDSQPQLGTDGNWVQKFLAHPVPNQPGTKFLYNTPATYMQSAIVQQTTGQRVVDYLQSRLFGPLGIGAPRWDSSPQDVSLGGYGLYLCTEDIAKFGQLYLQQGVWDGRQLIPRDWVRLATAKQVSNQDAPSGRNPDWRQGYGFQFWRCRNDAYRGDGKDGQFCVVIPEQDAVVVMTALTADLQGQLELVWTHILPAFHEEPLPENPEQLNRLRKRCAELVVKP